MVSLLLSICLCFSFSLFEILFVLVGSLAKSCASVAPVSEGRRQLLFGAHFAARDSGTVCIDPLSTKLLSTHQGFYILPNSTTATSLATLFPPSTHGSPDVQIVIRPAPAPSAIRCRPLSFSSSDRRGRSPTRDTFFFLLPRKQKKLVVVVVLKPAALFTSMPVVVILYRLTVMSFPSNLFGFFL